MLIKLDGVKTAEEALERSGLSWSVEQAPLITENGLSVESHKALFRGDNHQILGIVGSGYVPIQNTTAFAFFDTVSEKYGATYSYAGEIKEGKQIFLQAKIGKSFCAVPGDRVDLYITLSTGHDGSASLHAFMTPIRLFCSNQLVRSVKHASNSIHLKHTANISARIMDAMKVFNMSVEAFSVFEEKSRYLARKVVDRQMVEKFLKEVISDTGSTRAENQKKQIKDLFQNGKGNSGRSAWHLYNGLTEWVDHYRSADEDNAVASSLFGSGAALKEKAFGAALTL